MQLFILKNDDFQNEDDKNKEEEGPLDTADALLDFIEDVSKPKKVSAAIEKYPTCSICFDKFKINNEIRVISPCLHPFHAKCIDKWLTNFKGICPIDKQPVNCSKTIN